LSRACRRTFEREPGVKPKWWFNRLAANGEGRDTKGANVTNPPIANRGLDTEMVDAKYACFELERRWLVDPLERPEVADREFTLIDDRYIEGTRFRLRRMAQGARVALKLTKKYESQRPEARPIVTAYLAEAEYAVLAALPALPLRKRRYRLPIDGQIWSLDLFEGPLAGLELVEAEAESEIALKALVPPLWAVKEITHDPRYQCGSLAAASSIPEVQWPGS
jgi:CYTH domain-containing protein